MKGARGVSKHDLPLEWYGFKDTGCDLAPACLACPFPLCRHDVNRTGQVSHERSVQRAEAVLARRRETGEKVRDLALYFHLSQYTIYRIIRRAKQGAP